MHVKVVRALVVEWGNLSTKCKKDRKGMVILYKTPFYAEMGGQVGDTGILKAESRSYSQVPTDCTSPYKGVIAHIGKLENGKASHRRHRHGRHRFRQAAKNRQQPHRHPPAPLGFARILGEHIKQAGSVVDPQRLRFDFSHHKALTR